MTFIAGFSRKSGSGILILLATLNSASLSVIPGAKPPVAVNDHPLLPGLTWTASTCSPLETSTAKGWAMSVGGAPLPDDSVS